MFDHCSQTEVPLAARCACGRPVHIRKTGECRTCYHRRYARSRPKKAAQTAPQRLDPAEQFWKRTTRAQAAHNECWRWLGPTTAKGYGQAGNEAAHRVAYRLTSGQAIPSSLAIDHLCSVRSCVNPAHLEVVTFAENTRRAHQRNGTGHYLERCTHGHPLTPENVRIRTTSYGFTRDCCACLDAAKAALRTRTSCDVCGLDLASGSLRRHRRAKHGMYEKSTPKQQLQQH